MKQTAPWNGNADQVVGFSDARTRACTLYVLYACARLYACALYVLYACAPVCKCLLQ